MHRVANAATLLESAVPISSAQLESMCASLPRELKYGLSDLVPSSGTPQMLLVKGDVHLAGSLFWDDGADARMADGKSVDVLLVSGDLELDGDLINREGDYGPGLLVLGSVRARNVIHGGAVWVISGDLCATGCVIGHYNHGQLHIGGQLSAALLVSDDHDLQVAGACLALNADSAVREHRVVAEVLDYRNDVVQISLHTLLDRLVAELPVLREPDAPHSVLDAAVRGDLAMLNSALDCGSAVDARGVDGMTALMMAADQGRGDMVERLLAAGAAVNAADPRAWTPLRYASAANHPGIVPRLIAAGAEVDAVDDRGHSMLHAAISHNRGAVAITLMAHGARLAWPRHEARKLFGCCFTAAYNGYGELDESLILALLDSGLDVGLSDSPLWPEPLLAAAERATPQLLARLLRPSTMPPQQRHAALVLTPLHAAAMAGRLENLRLLLAQPWATAVLQAPDAGLLLALSIQGRELLERLEQASGKPRPWLPGPLADERYAVLDALLEAGVCATGHVRSVPIAALSGDPRVLARLLEAGAEVEASDAEGSTLLFLAVCHAPGDVDVALARLLLDRDADPCAPAPGHGSRDIAHAVAAGGDIDMLSAFVDALLRRGDSGRGLIPALLDIALQARERNRAMIVLDTLCRQAQAQSLAPLHQLLRERPRLRADEAHLDEDRQALAEATQRWLTRWPQLSSEAEAAQQALAPQRAQDQEILAGLRARVEGG